MTKDHRPYFIKEAAHNFHKLYFRHFLSPRFKSVGIDCECINPWFVEAYGPSIEIGNYVTMMGTLDSKVRFTVISDQQNRGKIKIGNYCIVNPGARLSSADKIVIGQNSMIASRAYITDSNWHDTYNRAGSFGPSAPIELKENVWVGDSAIVCKGVTIGKNSIIGAGSVVVDNIPPNSIAAGNPARVVKKLDLDKPFNTREQLLKDPKQLFETLQQIEKESLKDNTVFSWLGHLLFPKREA